MDSGWDGSVPNLSQRLAPVKFQCFIRGGFSSVYRSVLDGGQIEVAVKVIYVPPDTEPDERTKRKFESERAIWTKLKHPNILELLGYADNDRGFMPFGAFISPWCIYGHSEEYLQKEGGSFTLKQRLELLRGVARGLSYLHGHCHGPFIHGDIKPLNVVVDKDGVPKLCDFGLTKISLGVANDGTSSGPNGTERYQAPELLDNKRRCHPNRSSDIFALGCLGLKFAFRQNPHKDQRTKRQIQKAMQRKVDPATFPDDLERDEARTANLLRSTWAWDPSTRLNVEQFLSRLDTILGEWDSGEEKKAQGGNSEDQIGGGDTALQHTNWPPMGDIGLPLADLSGQIEVKDFGWLVRGGDSNIYQGLWNQTPVAVKVIIPTSSISLKSMRRKIRREQAIWARLNHPNILSLFGFAVDIEFGPFGAFISPWCSHGDSEKYLSAVGTTLALKERLNLLLGTANAVNYLHSLKPPLVHGDIKPANVLIDESGSPKLCDFGLSRIYLDEGNTGLTTTTAHCGTVRYLAPELLELAVAEYATPTNASDVYGLGCLGLFLIFSLQPYQARTHNHWGQIFEDIVQGVPPAEFPGDLGTGYKELARLLKACWAREPSTRPKAQEVISTLDEITLLVSNTVVQM